jgi:hypothetical protein
MREGRLSLMSILEAIQVMIGREMASGSEDLVTFN